MKNGGRQDFFKLTIHSICNKSNKCDWKFFQNINTTSLIKLTRNGQNNDNAKENNDMQNLRILRFKCIKNFARILKNILTKQKK